MTGENEVLRNLILENNNDRVL